MPSTAVTQPLLSNRSYDIGRNLTQYVIPGLGTLYFTLSGIWGFPYGEEVVGTLAAVGIFLGVVLGLSNRSYEVSGAKYDGVIQVDDTDDKTIFDLVLEEDPDALKSMDEIVFKVDHTKGSLS